MLSRIVVSALLGILLLNFGGCGNVGKPSDDAVTTSIKAKLYSEPLLKSASVDVVAKDGIVTLTGQVPDDAARLAAQHIAATTPGVKTVVDHDGSVAGNDRGEPRSACSSSSTSASGTARANSQQACSARARRSSRSSPRARSRLSAQSGSSA